MTWDEVLDLLIESKVADWYVMQGGDVEPAQAVYRADVSITLAWGAGDGLEFSEDWVKVFAHEPRAVRERIEVRVQGVPIFRTRVIVVDGGRCYLPMPKLLSEARQVPYRYMALVRLVEGIRPKGERPTPADLDFGGYVRAAGFVETSDRWPDA